MGAVPFASAASESGSNWWLAEPLTSRNHPGWQTRLQLLPNFGLGLTLDLLPDPPAGGWYRLVVLLRPHSAIMTSG
jgi:hypothetical protein